MAKLKWIDLTVYQGDPATIETTAEDADGNPIDFSQTGADAQFNMGRDWTNDPLIEYELGDAAMDGDSTGNITITLSESDTVNLNVAHRYVFTLWTKAENGDLRATAEGQMTIRGTSRRSA